VLGYCNPQYLAGGEVPLRASLAARALHEAVARPLGMALFQAAYGAYTIANANMIRAIKAVSTYRGRDPRDFALVAFGGSGPIHAAELARALHIRRVIVPVMPGLFSAVGLLLAQPEYYFVRTVFDRLESLDAGTIDGVYARLHDEAAESLRGEGYPSADAAFQRFADLRYAGQAYELTIPVESGRLAGDDLSALAERFGVEHERVYGHRAVSEPVELVNLRLVARVPGRPIPRVRPVGYRPAAGRGQRAAHFGPRFGTLTTPVLARGDLGPTPRCGPLIIEEYDATVVVPPRCAAWLHESRSIVIEVGEERDDGPAARSDHAGDQPA
jgi:N-methylhydantoinase A